MKKSKKGLTINKSTVCQLNQNELQQVQGGTGVFCAITLGIAGNATWEAIKEIYAGWGAYHRPDDEYGCYVN